MIEETIFISYMLCDGCGIRNILSFFEQSFFSRRDLYSVFSKIRILKQSPNLGSILKSKMAARFQGHASQPGTLRSALHIVNHNSYYEFRMHGRNCIKYTYITYPFCIRISRKRVYIIKNIAKKFAAILDLKIDPKFGCHVCESVNTIFNCMFEKTSFKRHLTYRSNLEVIKSTIPVICNRQ